MDRRTRPLNKSRFLRTQFSKKFPVVYGKQRFGGFIQVMKPMQALTARTCFNLALENVHEGVARGLGSLGVTHADVLHCRTDCLVTRVLADDSEIRFCAD